MPNRLIILFVCCFLLASPTVAFSGIYKYRDDTGRLIFVDDKSKIPSQYRDDISSVSEADDSGIVSGRSYPAEPSDNDSPEQTRVERLTEKKRREAYQTPVAIEGNRVLVPVQISMGSRTIKLSLLLDTGASRTVLHRQSLSGLDLPSGKSYNARVAGGGIVKSSKIQFRRLKVGPFEIQQASAMVISVEGKSLPYDGMLGMDFLKTHPYQIDFNESLITWEDNE